MEAEWNRTGQRTSMRLAPGIRFDRSTHGVWHGSEWIGLPDIEYRLLDYLVQHSQTLIPWPTLIAVAWENPRNRTPADLYRYIHHLRHVIEPDPDHPQVLRNERGLGYVLLTSRSSCYSKEDGRVVQIHR